MKDMELRKAISEELLESVRNYLERNYSEPELQMPAAMSFGSVCEQVPSESMHCMRYESKQMPPCSAGAGARPRKDSIFSRKKQTLESEEKLGENCFVPDSLSERLKQTEETFTQAVLRIIQKNNWTEPEVYNRIFMDRKLFNKIRNKPDYQPKKSTAILLALALRLNLDETLDLIGKAGFTLTHSSRADVIVEYFIQAGNYDVLELNEVLDRFGQPTLLKAE